MWAEVDGDYDEPVAGPKTNVVRQPAFAGLFYPADPEVCRAEAKSYLRAVEAAATERWIGGLVPHAGWIYSGAVAGQAMATLAAKSDAQVVVVFGAIHTCAPIEAAVLDVHTRWSVPGGESDLPADLHRKLAKNQSLFVVDELFHRREHAVEVELPLIQQAWPQAMLLPVEVPVNEQAVDIGRQTARSLVSAGLRAVFLASSDLTHYGPIFGFAPAGVGRKGIDWAKENDRRLLDLVVGLSAEKVVSHVREHQNACGGGAIAAMLAACLEMGATRSRLLQHTNSREVSADRAKRPPSDAVGYAGVIVG